MFVSFEPHTGIDRRTGLPIDFGQDRVFVDGVEVGFIGRKPGSPMNFIVRADGTVKAAVVAAIVQRWRRAPAKVSMPPEMPAELNTDWTDANE